METFVEQCDVLTRPLVAAVVRSDQDHSGRRTLCALWPLLTGGPAVSVQMVVQSKTVICWHRQTGVTKSTFNSHRFKSLGSLYFKVILLEDHRIARFFSPEKEMFSLLLNVLGEILKDKAPKIIKETSQ